MSAVNFTYLTSQKSFFLLSSKLCYIMFISMYTRVKVWPLNLLIGIIVIIQFIHIFSTQIYVLIYYVLPNIQFYLHFTQKIYNNLIRFN